MCTVIIYHLGRAGFDQLQTGNRATVGRSPDGMILCAALMH
jgi:hypothetical protein